MIEKYLKTESFLNLGTVFPEDSNFIRSEAVEVLCRIKTKPESVEKIFNEFFENESSTAIPFGNIKEIKKAK